MKKISLKLFIIILLITPVLSKSILPKKYKTLGVVSNGKGELYFRWFAPAKYWSEKGWMLKGGGVSKKILFSKDMIKILKDSKSSKRALSALNFSLLKIFMDFNEAKKSGLATVLKIKKKGLFIYRISAIGKKGVVIKSKAIDAYKPSRLPQFPKGLKAKNSKDGVELYWKNPKNNRFAPFAYKIYRKTAQGTWRLLSKPYLLTGVKWKENRAVFTDVFAPFEKKITYKIVGVDIFFRESKPSFVNIFHPDPRALVPPVNLEAKAIKNGIKLTWNRSNDPLTLGYVIERGTWGGGFFALLTPKPLKRKTTFFIDRHIKKEITYIYRIRSVNFRGKMGQVSSLASATLKDEKLPSRIISVNAKVFPNMIELRWPKTDKDTLGVIVEKRYKDYDKWVELNDRPIQNGIYKDFISYNSVGEVFYRVVNVGKNGKRSAYSKVIRVKLPGHLPLYAPNIKKIYTKESKVYLEFDLPGIGEKPIFILIHRGMIADAKGKVISKISAKSTKFTDISSLPGKRYWYALSAVGVNNQKSKIGRKYIITTGFPSLPIPQKPTLKYKKKPFRYIKIGFKKPPKGLGVTIFYKKDSDNFWIEKASDLKGAFFIDSDLPEKGIVKYKIAYNRSNLHKGKVSKVSEILLK